MIYRTEKRCRSCGASALQTIISFGETPWLGANRLDIRGDPFIVLESEEPTRFPILPDMIPPGHSKLHFSNPRSDVQAAIGSALRLSDLVIVIGLSANAPDYVEVADYVRHIRRDTETVHVDIRASSPMAALLKARTRRYRRVDPTSALATVRRVLDTLRRPSWCSASRGERIRTILGSHYGRFRDRLP